MRLQEYQNRSYICCGRALQRALHMLTSFSANWEYRGEEENQRMIYTWLQGQLLNQS